MQATKISLENGRGNIGQENNGGKDGKEMRDEMTNPIATQHIPNRKCHLQGHANGLRVKTSVLEQTTVECEEGLAIRECLTLLSDTTYRDPASMQFKGVAEPCQTRSPKPLLPSLPRAH